MYCKWSTYLFPWAVYLGVPLLAVQTHLDALAEEQTRPHDDVEHGALTLVVHGKIEHHWKKRGHEGLLWLITIFCEGVSVVEQKLFICLTSHSLVLRL